MTACEPEFENRGGGAVGEHLICSLMLLRFLPMRSGSQQCVNVVQRTRTFTAITRVQIPSGTPSIQKPADEQARKPQAGLPPGMFLFPVQHARVDGMARARSACYRAYLQA